MRIPDLIKETVIFLYEYDEKRSESRPIGTGFFVGLIKGDLFFPYLVTCRHVVEPSLKVGHAIQGRFNKKHEDPRIEFDPAGVDFETFPNEWVFHNDNAVDIAVLSWPEKNAKLPYRWAALPFEDAIFKPPQATPMTGGIKEGDEVFFIGLFAQYTGYERNFPVVRFGRIALVTDEPVTTELGLSVNLILETQAYPGNSGSPLFLPVEGPNGERFAALLGVVSGFWPDKQEVKVGQDGELQVYTHFGISIGVPATKIADILNAEEFVKKREDGINSQRMKSAP